MGKSVSSINVLVSSSAKAYVRGLDTAIKQTKSKGKQWKRAMTTVALGVGTALLGVGIASVKMSIDFETSLTKMRTLVGLGAADVEKFKEQIIELSRQTGRSAIDLSDSLYFITSSGLEGAAAFEALEASAKAAAIGMGETELIADALTSILNAYGHEAYSASEATNILLRTVKLGKIEADQLAATIGRVIPEAVQMGVTFEEVGSALATMSLTGKKAEEAATGLKSMLNQMLAPSKQMEVQLIKLGYSNDSLRESIKDKGLLQTLMDLKEALKGDQDAMGKLFGNVRALSAFLALTGKASEKYIDILGNMASGIDDVSLAMAIYSDTRGAQWNRMTASMGSAMITLGDVIGGVYEGVFTSQEELMKRARRLNQRYLDELAETARKAKETFKEIYNPTAPSWMFIDPTALSDSSDETETETETETESLTEKISRLNKELLEQAISGDISTTKLEELKEATFALKVAQDDLAYSIKNSSDIMGRSYETLPYMAGEGMELVSDEELDKLDKVDTKLKGISANMINLQNKYGEAFQFAAEALGQLTTIHATSMANQMAALTARQEKDRAEIALTLGKTKGAKDALMELDKKHAKERAKQASKTAKQQKILGIIQAAINTAIGVTRALRDKDFLGAAVIAGLGAAQVAVIASQYIPSFRFGTPYHFGGLAEINEGPSGGEIVNMPRGSSVTSTFDQMGGGKELMLKLDPHEIILYLQDQGAMFNYRTG